MALALRTTLCILTLAVVLNSTLVFLAINALEKLLPSLRHYTYIDDDFPAQLPLKLPAAGLVLQVGSPHYSLFADDDWGSLYPASFGFINIGPTNRTFLVSAMHQLHCLDVIRVAFVINDTESTAHVEHCLRYLRQIVLCYSDTTLEVDEPQLHQGRLTHAASGIGTVRRCRDWTTLRSFMDEHGSGSLQA